MANENRKKNRSIERREGGNNPLYKRKEESDRGKYREGKLKRKSIWWKEHEIEYIKDDSEEHTFCIRGQQVEERSKEENEVKRFGPETKWSDHVHIGMIERKFVAINAEEMW